MKQLIIHNLDVDTFLDLIGLDIADLVDLCEDQIHENYVSLLKAVE
ncbi:MAG: hypothetical protein KGI54_10680 [Pseudomonadota bacterium]|nr:hypothetical protein [Pseudomonadota bacterium]